MADIKVKYVRNRNKKIDLTLVTSLERRPDGNLIRCGWSFRSNHDVFKKKDGRDLAAERMNNNDPNHSSLFWVDEPSHICIVDQALRIIMEHDKTPKKYKQEIDDYLWWLTGYLGD